jgi:hypothetical protein
MIEDPRVVLKVSDVAKAANVNIPVIYKLIRTGDLLAIDMRAKGARRATWRVTRSSFEAYMAGASSDGST